MSTTGFDTDKADEIMELCEKLFPDDSAATFIHLHACCSAIVSNRQAAHDMLDYVYDQAETAGWYAEGSA